MGKIDILLIFNEDIPDDVDSFISSSVSYKGKRRVGIELKTAFYYDPVELRHQLQKYKDALSKYDTNRLILIAPILAIRYSGGFMDTVDFVVFWEQIYEELKKLRRFWSVDSPTEAIVASFTRTLERSGFAGSER